MVGGGDGGGAPSSHPERENGTKVGDGGLSLGFSVKQICVQQPMT